jgi:cell fate regulator YaaT (PSP1 superfamily)
MSSGGRPPQEGPIPVRPTGQAGHRPTNGHAAPKPVNGHGAPQPIGPSTGHRAGPPQILEVHFKGLRKDYFTFRHIFRLVEREFVVVEADRGQDLGWVKRAVSADTLACEGGCDSVGERQVPLPERRVLRRAAPADVTRLHQLRGQEMEVRRRTRALVQKHGLKMKVSEAEWQWDRNKLTVYFTAEKRVDFRALVRDMARTFRTRIELRQIGVRDEARRLGGLGRCRRELCCRSWLPTIEPVTLQLAKDQGLSLNPSQISGACGRLMNCLRYEHAVYQQAKKRFPPVGQRLRTSRGEEKVTGWNLFEETITLSAPDGEARTIPLASLREETRSAGGRSSRES